MQAGFLAAIARRKRLDSFADAPARLDARLSELGLEPAPATRSSRLWIERGGPRILLPGGRGMVVGTLFERSEAESPACVQQIDARTSDAIVGTKGRHLLENFWGSYVALLELPEGGVAMLRDPSAGQPAWFSSGPEVELFFSDPLIAVRLRLVDPTIDSEFVRHWLVRPHLRTSRTGLATVTELPPGTLRRSSGAGEPELAWSPWGFAAASSQIADFDEAAAALRLEARRTIPAYARGARAPLLELSGGLDSSIVAAVLAEQAVSFSSVNFATASPDGDERRYARLAAAASGSSLAELRQQDEALDLTSRRPLTARPGLSPVLEPIHDAFSRHAEAVGADLFLSGTGGDSLFCYLNTAAPVVDTALLNGPRSAGAAIRDVAELCECTIWTAARHALRKATRARRPRSWRRDESFLAPVVARIEAQEETHPWLNPPRSALPGKREHVEALVSILFFLDRMPATPGIPAVYPLMAQPLLELCLRIPTWMWIRDGRNRAVARAAFADLLPPEITHRRGKGRLESMCARAFVENRAGLRELLLDGLLSRDRLLDRPALESFLGAEPQPEDMRHFRVFDLATLELWRRSWASA
jgi:asparagine synthase (glutamine-hydrolysing)